MRFMVTQAALVNQSGWKLKRKSLLREENYSLVFSAGPDDLPISRFGCRLYTALHRPIGMKADGIFSGFGEKSMGICSWLGLAFLQG
jgi:hypothetical protein